MDDHDLTFRVERQHGQALGVADLSLDVSETAPDRGGRGLRGADVVGKEGSVATSHGGVGSVRYLLCQQDRLPSVKRRRHHGRNAVTLPVVSSGDPLGTDDDLDPSRSLVRGGL